MNGSIRRNHGALDGMTLLRFTHACKDGGGVERYLEDLNKALLERNRMTIIQFYLPDMQGGKRESKEEIGNGSLISIPLRPDRTLDIVNRNKYSDSLSFIINRLKSMVRNEIVYHEYFPKYLKRIIIRKNYSRYRREPLDVVEKFKQTSERCEISAIVIHSAGGKGASEVIEEASKQKIPYLILNHFSNKKFEIAGFREQAENAAGVGGVSSKDVPNYIRSRFENLSDGIDTEFFKKENAGKVDQIEKTPVILLPARIVPGKGHVDLMRAADQVIREGRLLKVAFAGREDMPQFKKRLLNIAEKMNLVKHICFLGHLTQGQLREWYANSSIVVLPSYSEGLGRILIEAQAMEKAVIAYDAGGVSEAVIDERTGYLVRPGEIRQLALRIKELISDDKKRYAMGKKGRLFVEKAFSYAALAQRHEDWYLSAIQYGKRINNGIRTDIRKSFGRTIK